MSKNYFTDEQVNNLISTNTQYPSHVNLLVVTRGLIKSLMNLAVETAIGEPLAYGVKFKSGMYGSIYNKENEARDKFIHWRHVYMEFEVLPFHKIQELEK